MKLLALETSTRVGSVAVLAGGKVQLKEQFRSERGHSSGFFSALARARQLHPQFDVIVVGLGPGSYSGVRIAIAAAIGLQTGLGAELLGIPSFLAFETNEIRYQAIGDARRGTFYYAFVEKNQSAEGPLLYDEATLQQIVGQRKQAPVFASESIAAISAAQIVFPGAVRLAHLAQQQIGIVARGMLEPIYLRPPHITNRRR